MRRIRVSKGSSPVGQKRICYPGDAWVSTPSLASRIAQFDSAHFGLRLTSWAVLCLTVILFSGCGRTPPAAVASAARTSSPPTTSAPATPSSPVASLLSNCSMVSSPEARQAASLTFDSRNQQFVLFGGDTSAGSVADTWLWNAERWTRYTGPAPSARSHTAMEYDPVGGKVVLYGGQNDVPGQRRTVLSDTWLWNGSGWTAYASGSQPKLTGPVMVNDAATASVVLFGIGASGSETWLWSDGQWTQAHPAHSPDAREDAAIAYATNSQQVVLFGGFNSGLGALNDTWVWNGTDWTNLQLSQAPSARLSATFVSGKQPILFGGSDNVVALSDTWLWTGAQWSRQLPPLSPSGRIGAAGASDGIQVVVVGGGSGSLFGDAWRWNGNDWAQC